MVTVRYGFRSWFKAALTGAICSGAICSGAICYANLAPAKDVQDIDISAAGRISLDGVPVNLEELEDQLSESNSSVIVRREMGSDLTKLESVLAIIHRLGREDFQTDAINGESLLYVETLSELEKTDPLRLGVLISLDPDGGIELNGANVSLDQLKHRLHTAKQSRKNLTVVVRGANSGVERILKVLGICDECQIKDAGVLRRRKSK